MAAGQGPSGSAGAGIGPTAGITAYRDQGRFDALSDAAKKALYEKAMVLAADAKADKAAAGAGACALAWALEAGYGRKQDDKAAVKWYETAVQRGSLQARTTLACRALERSAFVSARDQFEVVANLGDPDAIWHLSRLLRDGLGGAKDEKRAFELCEMAARQYNHDGARNTLGLMYETGCGCRLDMKRARAEWTMAAAHGYDDAVQNLVRTGRQS